ncbi:MAG TPA: DNA ligase D [Thermoleophilaceae bacterium]|nr:DNA ligase D [Thermoleophilaceae bacterium]
MADRLTEYRGKRDFEKTSEPAGGAADADGAPRFVVQEHHARRLHWDLRLERDGTLASWAVPNGIPTDPERNRKAVRTEDHPLEYLDFHGEIPEGEYGAGTMTIWDRGTYECEKWEERKLIVRFHGERLRGRYSLFRAGSEAKDWMIHRMDPPDEGREPMPERLVPMMARLGPLPADEAGWAFEIKWDGVRALAYAEPGRLRLESRNGNDITAQYPELRGLTGALGAREAVIDGEIVAFDDDGNPSFERLQQRMHHTSEAEVRRRMRSHPAAFMAFDLLHLDGRSLLREPYEERRRLLAGLGLDGEAWRTPEASTGAGAALLEVTRERGIEGLVAKRLGSRYEPGKRTGAWIKVKNTNREELVVGGWMPGSGRRRERLGALLVGTRDEPGGPLHYAGRVGTGFTEAELDRLSGLLEPLARDESPFEGRQPPRGARFAEPLLLAEVEFREWTRDGMLRAPSYKGLRDDKEAGEVAREEPVKLTNLDKVLYPASGFTKGEMIDYYRAIAPVLVPHLSGRPLTLKRYPDGVEAEHFYEKRCPKHRPDWMKTVEVPSDRSGGPIDFCVVDSPEALLWTAQLASIELHPSLSRGRNLRAPSAVAFDLDPGAPADIVDCCQVAVWLRGMFGQLGLEAFPKTSGQKGLQVYVPLNGRVHYGRTKDFAHEAAKALAAQFPDRVVSQMKKDLRKGKVFVDWSQNDFHKTTISVYSLRATPEPRVSTPVTWDEVEGALASGRAEYLAFGPAEVLERVERHGDLFAPVLSLEQKLP